jgi:hypothetical protein
MSTLQVPSGSVTVTFSDFCAGNGLKPAIVPWWTDPQEIGPALVLDGKSVVCRQSRGRSE